MKRKASATYRLLPALFLALMLGQLGAAPPTLAAEPAADTAIQEPSAEKQAVDEIKEPFGQEQQPEDASAGASEEAESRDECNEELENPEIQEVTREIVRSWSCHTFRWFDSWWGDKYDFDEKAVNGLVTFGMRYSEYYGFDPRFRLKVRAQLPNMTRRWDLLFGRVDEEAYVTDTQGQDRTFYNPGAVDRGEESAWLLGLGHRGKERRSGWDYSVGVRLRMPPAPYVKAQWYYNKDLSERSDFRFRQTFFWRLDQGFGTTSRGDLAYGIDDRNVLRWEAFATTHDKTEGAQWYAGQTWYHLVANRSAFSLRSFVRGETGADVGLKEYGIDMIWRRPFTREWLYLSVGPSVTWPREQPEDRREMSLGFNLWLEMEFGRWRY